jgi:hypothetical protein
MFEINYFKVLLLCKMMCRIYCMNADVDTLHVNRICLNDP